MLPPRMAYHRRGPVGRRLRRLEAPPEPSLRADSDRFEAVAGLIPRPRFLRRRAPTMGVDNDPRGMARVSTYASKKPNAEYNDGNKMRRKSAAKHAGGNANGE